MKTTTECPKCHTKLTKQQIGTGLHDCNPKQAPKPAPKTKRSKPAEQPQ